MRTQLSGILASLADTVKEPFAPQKLPPLAGWCQRAARVAVGHLLALPDTNLGNHLLAQVLSVHQGLCICRTRVVHHPAVVSVLLMYISWVITTHKA